MKASMNYSACSFYLSGQTTFETLDELSHELIKQADKPGEMVLDLDQVMDCDSVFVASLTACLQIKHQHGGSLVLANVPAKLMSMIEVYGLKDCGLQIRE